MIPHHSLVLFLQRFQNILNPLAHIFTKYRKSSTVILELLASLQALNALRFGIYDSAVDKLHST